MVTTSAEAFLLLALNNVSLHVSNGANYSGVLNLECVTMALPPGFDKPPSESNRDVYLVLKIEGFETPIDPAKVVIREDGPGWRTYTLKPSAADASEVLIRLWPPMPDEHNAALTEDLETFDGILTQYVEVRYANAIGSPTPGQSSTFSRSLSPPPHSMGTAKIGERHGDDMRGRVVMINEDTGEVLGELDHKLRVREDANLQSDQGAVVLEIPEERTGREQDATAMEMFVRAIPPEEQDWITKSATIVSHAISTTTNLLLTTITTASNYYINNYQPSPHHPNNRAATTSGGSTPAPAEKGAIPGPSGSGSGPSTPQPPPSRTLMFLTSEDTRRNLSTVHAVSGKAVEVSTKTISTIDNLIRRAIGSSSNAPGQPASGSRARMANAAAGGSSAPGFTFRGANSAGPGRGQRPGQTAGPAPPPPMPPRSGAATPAIDEGVQQAEKLSKKAKILFSLDLVLSTIDDSTRKLIDHSADTIGNIAEHKYGSEVGESTRMITGTARNVGLVYVDLSGLGRRAILKRAGKQYIKGKISSGKTPHLHEYKPPARA